MLVHLHVVHDQVNPTEHQQHKAATHEATNRLNNQPKKANHKVKPLKHLSQSHRAANNQV